MKILMLTPYLPYPTNSGGQIRSNNLIKHLSKKHEITLCSLIKYEKDRQYAEKLKPYCKQVLVFKRPEKPWTLENILRTGFSSYPFLVMRNWAKGERKALQNLLKKEKFDIIHAETFYVMPHIPKTNIPIVLVDQTIEYQVYSHYVRNYRFPFLKPLLFVDVYKTKFWETYYWKKAKQVIAVSDRDASVMRSLVPGLKPVVVPNGVGEDLVDDIPLHFNKTLLFMGSGWLQNVEAANILTTQVFPLVIEQIADAKLILAGQLGERVKKLESSNIKVIEIAPDDIDGQKKCFRNSGVMVTPLYGPGGTRLKILGSMAARLPVVTTKTGITGIEARDGQEVLIGESPAELAALTVKILKDKSLYNKIANNARKFVEGNYFYESISKKLDQVYQGVKDD